MMKKSSMVSLAGPIYSSILDSSKLSIMRFRRLFENVPSHLLLLYDLKSEEERKLHSLSQICISCSALISKASDPHLTRGFLVSWHETDMTIGMRIIKLFPCAFKGISLLSSSPMIDGEYIDEYLIMLRENGN